MDKTLVTKEHLEELGFTPCGRFWILERSPLLYIPTCPNLLAAQTSFSYNFKLYKKYSLMIFSIVSILNGFSFVSNVIIRLIDGIIPLEI